MRCKCSWLPAESSLTPKQIMKKQTMIVQFKNEGGSLDIDWFYDLNEILQDALKRKKFGSVDGSDFGTGTMNLYIVTHAWRRALELILMNLRLYRVDANAVIVSRRGKNQYTVLWPPDFCGDFSEL
jgi:hypothetical protein